MVMGIFFFTDGIVFGDCMLFAWFGVSIFSIVALYVFSRLFYNTGVDIIVQAGHHDTCLCERRRHVHTLFPKLMPQHMMHGWHVLADEFEFWNNQEKVQDMLPQLRTSPQNRTQSLLAQKPLHKTSIDRHEDILMQKMRHTLMVRTRRRQKQIQLLGLGR